MMPAGAWVRVSTGRQDEANQESDIERYCAGHDYTIVKRYKLNDISAYKGEQDVKLAEMLADVASGTISVLVVWHSDRLERRGVEALFRLLRSVREAGGHVESVGEPMLGKADMSGEALTALSAIMANQESVHKSERIRIAFDRIKANGAVIGRAPYGYTIEGNAKYEKRFTVVESETEIIRESVKRYLRGETLQRICDDLNRRGIPLPHKPRNPETSPGWIPKSLSQVISNPTIAGRHSWGGQTVKVPAIVSLKDFNDVRNRLASRAHRKGVPSDKANTALLTSVIKCGSCGRNIYPITTGANRVSYYYCRSRQGCKNMIRASVADSYMTEWIATHRSYELLDHVTIRGENHANEIDQVRQDIRELDPESDGYDDALDALRSELRRLRSLPVVPDRIEWAGTGRYVSDEWATWTRAERRKWLLDNGFTVTLLPRKGPLRLIVKPGDPYRAKVGPRKPVEPS